MKNIKALTLLCLILFLSAIGCTDFINWLGGEDLEDHEYTEETQDEKEGGDEILIFHEKQNIDRDRDRELEKRDALDEIERYNEIKRKQDIDRYKDREPEKRDAEGNKTYYEKW